MSTVDEIEDAVTKLASGDFDRFRAWFEAFDAEKFDQKIERDIKSGRLDRLADEAIADFRAGHSRGI